MMDPATVDVSMADMDYKGAFSMGETGQQWDAFKLKFKFSQTFTCIPPTDPLCVLPLQARLCMAGFCGTLSRT